MKYIETIFLECIKIEYSNFQHEDRRWYSKTVSLCMWTYNIEQTEQREPNTICIH